MLLETIEAPGDLRPLDAEQMAILAAEIRDLIVGSVAESGGHLGSNLGAVELTLALHRVFESPWDIILWDTGHQAYVHKILTGRRDQFVSLRQAGGLSGYPSRDESAHDWVENSHASTILSYAYGLAAAIKRSSTPNRRVIAVIGDGAMTGGLAYEGLNNLGHSGSRVVIVVNDNGRSYAPTVSRLTESLTRIRLHPGLKSIRSRLEAALQDLPAVGPLAYSSLLGLYSAIREVIEPPAFFESLGVRYVGPIDGHDLASLEHTLAQAAAFDGPIAVHVLTDKGRGYAPAERDDEKCLHDAPVFDAAVGPTEADRALKGFTQAFSEAMIDVGESFPRVVAITAAMAGPTGLLPFRARWPQRFFDAGIAEAHAVTSAAGMAMGGLRPVVAVYSTFFARAFDQAMYDVGLHRLPVIFALDRAGITGDDGPSHHGVLDIALCLKVPGMTILAPSSRRELGIMLLTALAMEGPVALRYPKGAAREVGADQVGDGLHARQVRAGGGEICILAVGKMVAASEAAAVLLACDGLGPTVWDVRSVRPLDETMLADAAGHRIVVTVEDGIRSGGAGSFIGQTLADRDPGRTGPPVVILGTPPLYLAHGKPDAILARLGLDGPGIANAVRRALDNSRGGRNQPAGAGAARWALDNSQGGLDQPAGAAPR